MFPHLALVVSYAHLGRNEEAAKALEGLLRLQPGLSEAFLRRTYSTADPEFVERLIEGVRIAGLQE